MTTSKKKIVFKLTYDTETGRFLVEDTKNAEVKHSGSSYLRVIDEATGNQLGTIGAYCPGPQKEAEGVWNDCDYAHLCICMDKRVKP